MVLRAGLLVLIAPVPGHCLLLVQFINLGHYVRFIVGILVNTCISLKVFIMLVNALLND